MTDLPLAGELPAISQISRPKLAAWLTARGEPAYRADQVLSGVHRPEVSGFDDLTDLPAALRRDLRAAFRVSSIEASHVLEADGGLTAKAVHELADGQRVESVLMRYRGRGGAVARTTICISSQAGCAVGCPFCATGQAGFARQLSPAEIVDQVLHWHRQPWQALGADWPASPNRGHYNIVFMGMGEPLNNTDRVFEAVRLLNEPARLGIGARHITVSTSGVVPGMERMVEELPQVNLAISLHAADDALRDELVPINRKWPIASVIDAGKRFAARTRRRVSLEYVMIDGMNDTLPLAERLVALASGWRSHVNLIPLNPTPGSRWSGTPPARVAAFVGVLEAAGVATTVRDTRGREIEAACGQLHAQLAGRVLDPRSRCRRRPHGELTVSDVRPPQISASILNADFAHLGEEVERAASGGVDSIHLDVMDGHFVPNITMGPVAVEAVRPYSRLPYHSHLMISRPLQYAKAFADAGSDVIIFHLEADDPADEVIAAIRAAGRLPGLAINPETPGEAALPYLDRIAMLLVMTVNPGWGGQAFIAEVLPKLRALREEAERRGLDLPIGVDGGVNLATIGGAYAAGGDVLVTGKALYENEGDLTPAVAALRAAALGGAGALGTGAATATGG